MIKALVDTNVFLEIINLREFHREAGEIIETARKRDFLACVATHQVTTIAYYARKSLSRQDEFRALMSELLGFLHVIPVSASNLKEALYSRITDFEDAVLESAALHDGADFIVTRNAKDFKDSRVKALSPAQFLKLLSDEAESAGLIREPTPSYRTRPRRRRKAKVA
jgi:predicted nucleic acid-binding protein